MPKAVTLMRIFSKGTLREFWQRHPDSEQALLDWYQATRRAKWDTPAAVMERYPSASILSYNRAVFRIKGNAYRLVVEINYRAGRVYIRFVGTHAEYNGINAIEV